jgi:hypothetical protein
MEQREETRFFLKKGINRKQWALSHSVNKCTVAPPSNLANNQTFNDHGDQIGRIFAYIMGDCFNVAVFCKLQK